MSRPDREMAQRRLAMVAEQIEGRGIMDRRVIEAMRRLPREDFVPPDLREESYADRPLPIGEEATISQPFIVAYMTERLQLMGGEKVLEVGTGSGYQSAVLASIAREVCSVEIDEGLALAAGRRLEGLGLGNVKVRVGDGLAGWPEEAPFDRILLTCGVPSWPPALKAQLRPGGWMLAPIGGEGGQVLRQLVRLPDGFKESEWMAVSFVQARRRP